MRKSKTIKQLAALASVSIGLVVGMSSSASAEVVHAGVWMKDGHSFTMRASASTSSANLHTFTDPKVRVPCTTTPCTRNNNGGSYKCWTGGPSDNDWLKVTWGGRTGWVAAACVEVGRI
ncbi:hypothetical protein [Streptomyces sp. NPDC127063]|uniref:hypothetical protein n=1 Tax=Streptomyces sp. NPDC127063 TaxID=3347123 RepID=UPI00364D0D17